MSVNLQINNKQVSVVPNSVPVNQSKTESIFNKLGFKLPENSSSLKERCTTLEKLGEKLEKTEKTQVRDKILAFVATAFALTMLSAGILTLTLATGGAAIGVGVGCLAAYVGFSAYFMYASSDEKPSWIKMLSSPILGPFMTIFRAFTKIPFIKSEMKRDSQEVGDKFVEMAKFYQTHREQLHLKIDAEIEKTTTCLNQMKEFEIKNPIGEKAYQDMLADFKKAKDDLETGSKFYSTHVPN